MKNLFNLLFILLSTLLTTLALAPSYLIGLLLGLSFSAMLVTLRSNIEKVSTRSYLSFIAALFIGSTTYFISFYNLYSILQGPLLTPINLAISLASFYSSFIIFSASKKEKVKEEKNSVEGRKKILLTLSALKDSRLSALASSGILDGALLLPLFAEEKLLELSNSDQEEEANSAIKAQETIEELIRLNCLERINHQVESDQYSEKRSSLSQKTQLLAKTLNAHILQSDQSTTNEQLSDSIKIINLNALSKSLKPIMEKGETFKIKVQRYGKEPKQGVGYLDDGTMVVINGGGDFIGDVIAVQLLSVKHTSSGRMIFCNTLTKVDLREENSLSNKSLSEESAKNYFPL